MVRVEGGDRVPADMLTLYSDGDQGTLFLKTDQLDGETDWKLRKSVKNIQSGIRTTKDVIKLLETDVSFIVEYFTLNLVHPMRKFIPSLDSS